MKILIPFFFSNDEALGSFEAPPRSKLVSDAYDSGKRQCADVCMGDAMRLLYFKEKP